jgi:hypothetical protein
MFALNKISKINNIQTYFSDWLQQANGPGFCNLKMKFLFGHQKMIF